MKDGARLKRTSRHTTPCLPIPTKPAVSMAGMIAPRDSGMMPLPYNEMVPPGAPRMLAE